MCKFVGVEARNLSVCPRVDSSRSALAGLDGNDACYLDNVSFGFSEGDKVFVKSDTERQKKTLLRVLSGLVPPTSGTFKIEGNLFPGISPTFSMMPRATLQQNATLRGMILGLRKESLNIYCDRVFSNPDLRKHRNTTLIDASQDLNVAFWVETLAEIRPSILLIESWFNPPSNELKERCKLLFEELVVSSDIAVISINNASLAKRVCTMKIEFDGCALKDVARDL